MLPGGSLPCAKHNWGSTRQGPVKGGVVQLSLPLSAVWCRASRGAAGVREADGAGTQVAQTPSAGGGVVGAEGILRSYKLL